MDLKAKAKKNKSVLFAEASPDKNPCKWECFLFSKPAGRAVALGSRGRAAGPAAQREMHETHHVSFGTRVSTSTARPQFVRVNTEFLPPVTTFPRDMTTERSQFLLAQQHRYQYRYQSTSPLAREQLLKTHLSQEKQIWFLFISLLTVGATFHFAKSLVNTELKQFHASRAERGKSSTFSFPSSPHLASPACHFLYPCLTREGLSLLPPLPGEFSVPNPALTTHWHVHFKQIRVQVSNYCLTRRCDFKAEISKALRWQCTMLASLTAASAPQPQAEDLGLFPGKAQ